MKTGEKGKRMPGFCLFAFFLSFYYLTNAGGYLRGDQHFMRQVAINIVDHGQLGFQLVEPVPEQLAFDFVKGPDGRYYAKWGIGQSLVEVPFYFLHRLIWRIGGFHRDPGKAGNEFLVSEMAVAFLSPSVMSALGCVLVYWFGLSFGFSVATSLLLGLIYGLGTMAWPYSKMLFSEATLSVAILGAVYASVRYAATREKKYLIFSGIGFGFALITKVTAALVIPLAIVYLLKGHTLGRVLRDMALYLIPPLLFFLMIQLWHNDVRYGSPFRFGYVTGLDRLGFSNPLFDGLWGLLLSPGKSFFLYVPAALLGVWCYPRFFRARRREAFFFLSVCVAILALHASWWSWSGDWAWGPRFLVPLIPYVIIPTGYMFSSWSASTRRARGLVIALLVFSVCIQVLGVAVNPFMFLEIRTEAANEMMSLEGTAAGLFFDVTSVNFIPMFSHVLGNWWLFKHMVFAYDFALDAPWARMVDFDLELPLAIAGDKVRPFWWLTEFPAISPSSIYWVYPLAAVNLLIVLWFGLRIMRPLKNTEKKQTASMNQTLLKDALSRQNGRAEE